MKKYLCFDISNLLYRTFHVQTVPMDDEELAGLAAHSALMTLNKYFKQHKPDQVVMAFDRKSWRKDYTASALCISGRPYKGNRRKDMSPAQQAKYERFLGHLSEFESMIAQCTTIISLRADHLEADDLIAGFAQMHTEDEVIIISADSDLLQLKIHPNVTVITPATDKEQSLKEYDNDAAYYLFQKCVRGDSTDNVQSALPRVRATRIRKAYDDPFERVSLMKEKWTNEQNKEFIVEDLFEENQLLIDLSMQPEPIRKAIESTIKQEMERERAFSMFFIMKFIGKYKLNKIRDSIDQYIPLLSRQK